MKKWKTITLQSQCGEKDFRALTVLLGTLALHHCWKIWL